MPAQIRTSRLVSGTVCDKALVNVLKCSFHDLVYPLVKFLTVVAGFHAVRAQSLVINIAQIHTAFFKVNGN